MTLIEEMIAAGRGMLALITSRRNASTYFNLTLVGLVGSFVAFFVSAGISTHTSSAVIDLLIADAIVIPENATMQGWPGLLALLVSHAIKLGFAAISLNWMKRVDGFVPFLVASNWADLFSITGFAILVYLGLGASVLVLIFGGMVFLVHINIARLIVTLRPMQIVLFFVTQFVGSVMAIIVISSLFVPASVLTP